MYSWSNIKERLYGHSGGSENTPRGSPVRGRTLGRILGIFGFLVLALIIAVQPVSAAVVWRCYNVPTGVDIAQWESPAVQAEHGEQPKYFAYSEDALYDYQAGVNSTRFDYQNTTVQEVGIKVTVNTAHDEGQRFHIKVKLKRFGMPNYYMFVQIINANDSTYVLSNELTEVWSQVISTSGTLCDFGYATIPNGTWYILVCSWAGEGEADSSNYVKAMWGATTNNSTPLVWYDATVTPDPYVEYTDKKLDAVLTVSPDYTYVYQTFTWDSAAPLMHAILWGGTTTWQAPGAGYSVQIYGTETVNGKVVPNLEDREGYANTGSDHSHPLTSETALDYWVIGGNAGETPALQNGIMLDPGVYAVVLVMTHGTLAKTTGQGALINLGTSIELNDAYAGGECGYGNGYVYDVNWTDMSEEGFYLDFVFWTSYENGLQTTVPDPTTYVPTTVIPTTATTPTPTGTTTPTATTRGPGGDFPDFFESDFFSSTAGHWLITIAGMILALFVFRKPAWVGVLIAVIGLSAAIVTGFIDGWVVILVGLGLGVILWRILKGGGG